jgi:hypothetical protein
MLIVESFEIVKKPSDETPHRTCRLTRLEEASQPVVSGWREHLLPHCILCTLYFREPR